MMGVPGVANPSCALSFAAAWRVAHERATHLEQLGRDIRTWRHRRSDGCLRIWPPHTGSTVLNGLLSVAPSQSSRPSDLAGVFQLPKIVVDART
jgi:hypothetical protein